MALYYPIVCGRCVRVKIKEGKVGSVAAGSRRDDVDGRSEYWLRLLWATRVVWREKMR